MRYIRFMIFFYYCLSSIVYATVKIGTPVFEPPFVVNVKNHLEGFDIELMHLICARLTWECEFIAIPENYLFEALAKHKIDFAIGGLVIPEENRTNYLFSMPYLPSEGNFITLRQSTLYPDDLKNRRIGVLKGSAYAIYLIQSFPWPVNLSTYDVYGDLILALKNNQVDFLFTSHYTALYLQHQYPELIRASDKHFIIGKGIALATLASKKELMEEINKILLQFKSDETFKRLYNYYFQFSPTE